jgi:hypothetical protein
MDPVHLVLAFAPLGLYVIGLGIVHWRRRPVVLAGSTDISLLSVAVVGLAIVGPMEFFLPAALPLPGQYVWLMLLFCYSLLVMLWNLLARPRLVILNIAIDRLRPILTEIAARLDSHPQWAGDSLALEELGVQLHLEDYHPMRTVSLIATGARQSETGWARLRTELAAALRGIESPDRRRGYAFLAVGLLMLAWPLGQALALGTPIVAEKLADLLRL